MVNDTGGSVKTHTRPTIYRGGACPRNDVDEISRYDIIVEAHRTFLRVSQALPKHRPCASIFNQSVLRSLSALRCCLSMVTSSLTRSVVVSLILILLLALLASCASRLRSPRLIGKKETFASGRILIKFNSGSSSVSMTESAKKFDLRPSSISCGSVHIHSVRPGTELEAAEVFTLDPAVDYAEPDFLIFAAADAGVAGAAGRVFDERGDERGVKPRTLLSTDDAGTPDDPFFDKQWALAKIEAESAWKVATGSNVTIAVIDSGVDLDHPELALRVVEGYDFVNDDSEADDDYGHGTLVAGVAAAAANNGAGIAGLAWNSRIMPVKVLDEQGQV